MKNRFLLLKCIALGALSFPTPFFMYFYLAGIDPGSLPPDRRFLVIAILLMSGALVGLASFYKDTAVATLKDWYPSDKPLK